MRAVRPEAETMLAALVRRVGLLQAGEPVVVNGLEYEKIKNRALYITAMPDRDAWTLSFVDPFAPKSDAERIEDLERRLAQVEERMNSDRDEEAG